MKRILLSKTSKRPDKHYALVDDEDFEWLNQWNWTYGSHGYAYRREHLPSSRKHQKCNVITMHRLIMDFPNTEVDHRDRNKLNNQRSNLRICTSSQNKTNRGLRADNKSGYAGIIFSRNRWLVRIWVNGKAKHLGYYPTIKEAVQVRKRAVKHFYGDFGIA